MAALADEPVPLKLAPQLLPGCPHWRTLRRWWKEGLHGGKVRLTVQRTGTRVFVTRAALAAFQRAVDAERDRPPPGPTPRARRRASEAAARYADSFDARPPG
jgi:hypothetical protein